MISSLTRDLPIDGLRACVSRIGPAFHGTDIGLRQIPFACCQGDPFDIAWLRHACCSSSQKIDHRAHTPRSMTYGQIPDIVKTLVQKLVGVKSRNIARGEPPQNAVDDVTPVCTDRTPSINANEKTVIGEHGRTHCPGARTATLHGRTIHIGAISEIERHDPDIAEVAGWSQRERSRIAASSRSISRS